MLRHIIFPTFPERQPQQQNTYKVGILIKDKAFTQKDLMKHYVMPLKEEGVCPSQVVALNLVYNESDKANVKLIRQHLEYVGKFVEQVGITHLLVADASYFKVLCKVKKAEPHYGYVLPSILPGVQASLTINYQQLFYNPDLQSRLTLGLQALVRDMNDLEPVFNTDFEQCVDIIESESGLEQAFNDLITKPILTLDVETLGLSIPEANMLSYSFGTSTSHAISVSCNYRKRCWSHVLLRKFLDSYQGTLVFHNASFDVSRLIINLWMKHLGDISGLLRGLKTLYRSFDDTRILTYLATNSAAGNELSLKKQAQEFAGNYGLDDMSNMRGIDQTDLLIYNGVDALSTAYVYNKYREQVRETQESVYQDLFKPSLVTLTQTEMVGMPVNWKEVQKLGGTLETERLAAEQKIDLNPLIPEFEDWLRLDAAITATAKLKKLVKTADDFSDLKFNPNSHKQVQALLYDHLELPALNYTDTGQPSTDGKTLKALIHHIKKEHNLN